MAVSQASSRLEMLQARFQQKQMQEKEQKLLQLYDQQQQRAYQVVQRGSAGSTNSVSQQHSVTKTTTAVHTTGTTQGGKVRQMFDERRQTTVKGIDRSYPLEPLLDNKTKRQIATSNGHVPSKPHQQGTVTRQIVTVRRTARSDVNSNVNGGKPVVSYHEEVSHESFGNDNEFGNENHNDEYHDENDRSPNRNGVHIEEILDDDTIGRNRMLAKIHLMEYDKNLKHRVNNDLDNEQFPEDLMVDVPDKLPRKPATKKLSQAEARLERFKNANAKRNTSNIRGTTNRPEVRKRSEPMFPSSKTTSRKSTVKSETSETVKVRSSIAETSKMIDTVQSPEPIACKIATSETTETVEPVSPRKLVKPAAPKEIPAPVKPVKQLGEPRLVKTVKSVIKTPEPSRRVQKSPSPDPAGRKTSNLTSKPLTRRSFPPSPSKSPDIVKRHGSANAKSPEPRTPKLSSQGAQRNHEAANINETKTTSKGTHRTKIIETSDVEYPLKSQPETGDTKSTSTLKNDVKSPVDDADGDSKEKESEHSSQKPETRKYSTERESISQNQRQRSPNASPSPRPPSALSTASSTTSSTRGTSHSADSPARRMATKAKTPTRSPVTTTKPRPSGPPSARSGPAALSSESLTPCKICGRRFAQDRITLHEKICTKTGQKKRKQFDAGLHRVQGTELEAFVKKGGPVGRQAEHRAKAKKPEVKAKSNWRRKHEDFINAIRSAKQVQAHLAAGGKLSDLPPPPASDTSDYIQCPHCGRKFNQGAAERHIPKCATMMHNKPNPRAPPRPKR